jgi:hypothetical protein
MVCSAHLPNHKRALEFGCDTNKLQENYAINHELNNAETA